jgi:hypothetical protein
MRLGEASSAASPPAAGDLPQLISEAVTRWQQRPRWAELSEIREQRISWVLGEMRMQGYNVDRDYVARIVDEETARRAP